MLRVPRVPRVNGVYRHYLAGAPSRHPYSEVVPHRYHKRYVCHVYHNINVGYGHYEAWCAHTYHSVYCGTWLGTREESAHAVPPLTVCHRALAGINNVNIMEEITK